MSSYTVATAVMPCVAVHCRRAVHGSSSADSRWKVRTTHRQMRLLINERQEQTDIIVYDDQNEPSLRWT